MLRQVKIHLLHDPDIPVLEMKFNNVYLKVTHNLIFIIEYTIMKTWKQPMWYIYSTEYHTAIKKYEIPSFEA